MQETFILLKEIVWRYSPRILIALGILFIGFWIINRISGLVERMISSRKMDETLKPFLKSMINVVLKLALIGFCAMIVGIRATSFVALLGAMGIAIGIALQGSLSHFAGGMLLMGFKPFKVGDIIKAQDETGTVKAITVFNTIIETPQKQIVYLPNGPLSSGKIINYSKSGRMRLDINFIVDFKSDFNKIKALILDIIIDHPLVHKQPAPNVYIEEMGEKGMKILVTGHTNTHDFLKASFDIKEKIKHALEEAGIDFGIKPS